MRKIPIAVKYAFFALVSIGFNLLTQKIFFSLYRGAYSLYAGILFGTGVGLIVKYILDKRYIFYYETGSYSQDLLKFLLYSLMGVITTAIFWVFEITFHYLFAFEQARYIGALLGLMIGYTSKYFLDKQLVFTRQDLRR